ncbi:uncharacterized protein [Dermacentor andersoni]|uniref:uncharacterized protein isoform X2 n=1 Tax=Dermacentor andersoni TaxID=34620 RepID=UPI002415EBE2|nr:uncharacterized protein LOC126529972 isoform X2 [Dermacentor andersoni]
MHHFRERLKEEERRRDEEMLQSSDSWRSAQQNGHTITFLGALSPWVLEPWPRWADQAFLSRFPKVQGWPSLVPSSTGGWQHGPFTDALASYEAGYKGQQGTTSVGHDAAERMGRLPLLFFQITFLDALSLWVLEPWPRWAGQAFLSRFPKVQGWPSLVPSSTGGWQHGPFTDALASYEAGYKGQQGTTSVGHDAAERMGRLPLLFFQDNVVTRGATRLGIRSPTDDLMLDEPIVRLGRRGVAARMRADTDPLGLRSGTDRGPARTRRRASPASEDQGPTLEELLQKKAESRRQERLSEQRQLELADTLYPFGRRPESRMAMMSGSRRPSASSSIEEIECYSPWGKGVGNPSPNQNFKRRSREKTIAEETDTTDQTFFTGGRSPARIPRRARSRGVSDVTLQEDGDTEDTFPWARSTVPPRERQGALAGLSFSEKMVSVGLVYVRPQSKENQGGESGVLGVPEGRDGPPEEQASGRDPPGSEL